MANIKLAYASASDATITLASLASDTNLLAGRESAAIDNTSSLYLDILVSGKITTGTSPTASKTIEVWAVGSWDGTSWPDVFDGTDSAETITSIDIKANVCNIVAAMATNATSNTTYHFGPISLASIFGGKLPPKVSLFVTHNTAVNLNATSSNHQIRLQPVYENLTGSGTESIADDAVTYAKIQNVSATDRILGRSSAGAGDIEEITCTSFARSILDDTSASDVRSTISVQPTASPAFTGGPSIINSGASDNSTIRYGNASADWYVGLRGDTSNVFAITDASSFRLTISTTGVSTFSGSVVINNDGNVVPLTVTNAGTANSFVVNDASGDTSPFVIDAAGNVGIGLSSPDASTKLHLGGTYPTSGTVTRAILCNGLVPSGSTVFGDGLVSFIGTVAASFTCANLRHFVVAQGSIGAGSSVTNQFGYVAESSLTGATNNYGFYSDIASGTGRWNFYSNGTAPSFFGGQLLVTAGSVSAPGVAFNGDGNTGLAQIGGADTASIVTAGVERVRVGSNGRVQFFANSEKFGVQLNNGSTQNGPFIGSDGAEIFTVSASSGAERMRIDASGNVGIGTQSVSSGFRVDVRGRLLSYTTSADGLITAQGLQAESAGTGKSAIQIDVNGKGGFAWQNDASSGTRTLRLLENSGYGAGDATALLYSGGAFTFSRRLDITQGTTTGAQAHCYVRPENGGLGRDSQITFGCTFSNGWGGADLNVRDAGAIRFGANGGSADPRDWSMRFLVADGPAGSDTPRECMRVNAAGELLIGTTTDQGNFKLQVAGNTYLENLYLSTTVNYGRLAISHAGATTFAAGWNNTDTSSTGQTTLNILRNGVSVGTISTTNAATSYNTTSDYRLKANPRPITNATERIARIKPSQWDWHVGGVGEGFIAHELVDAVPLAVTGEKDAVDATGNPVWQTVDMSKVVPVLVAALQEANARIAALEERLNHA